MSHELKVIYGKNYTDTRIFLDDQPVGLVQSIKTHVDVNGVNKIEIIFPNYMALYESTQYGGYKSFSEQIRQVVNLLKEMPNVEVKLENIMFDSE